MCNISRKDGEKERERERERETERRERNKKEKGWPAGWLRGSGIDARERPIAAPRVPKERSRAGDRFNIFSEELIPFHEVV